MRSIFWDKKDEHFTGVFTDHKCKDHKYGAWTLRCVKQLVTKLKLNIIKSYVNIELTNSGDFVLSHTESIILKDCLENAKFATLLSPSICGTFTAECL